MKICTCVFAVLSLTAVAWAEPQTWKGCPPQAHAVFRRDSRQFALAGHQGAVTLYDPDTGKKVVLERAQFTFGEGDFSPDSKVLAMAASGFRQPFLALYQPGRGREAREVDLKEGGTTWTCRYSSDGQSLFTGGGGGVRQVVPRTGQLLRHFPSRGEVSWLALSPSGSRLAMTDGESLMVYEVDSGKCLSRCSAVTQQVQTTLDTPDQPRETIPFRMLAWTPDEKAVIASSYLGPQAAQPLVIIDPATGQVTARLVTRQAVTGMALSPDGKTLVTASYDGDMRWWEATAPTSFRLVETSRCQAPGKEGLVGSLTFSPDGRWLVVTSAGASALLFDVATRQIKATIEE